MPFTFANSSPAGVIGGAQLPASLLGGKLRVAVAEFTCASDPVGTYTAPIRLPAGARVLFGFMNASVSMGGTATIAIGISGTPGKYRAAATYTATDTFTLLAPNAVVGVALTAEEQIIMTVAAASLPASGRLVIGFVYSQDN